MSATTSKRGADLAAEALAEAGVRTVFSLSGNQIMPIYDALLETEIRLVHVRHEAAAVFMAEAHAQVTGGVGVALLTAGPGFANGLSAMYSARTSETPVLILTGDAPLSQAGRGAFQEMAQTQAAGPMTKASLMAGTAEGVFDDVAGAIALATSGRPGPVHLAIPFDLVNAAVDGSGRNGAAAPPAPAAASDEQCAGLLDALSEAERPLILTGPILCRAQAAADMQSLREATGLPVITMESPRGLRDPRLGAAAEVLREADLILALGKPFDFLVGFGNAPAISEACGFLQVDADADVLDRDKAAHGTRMRLSLHAEPRATAQALTALAAARTPANGQWRQDVEAAVAYRPPEWDTVGSGNGALHPVQLARGVGQVLDHAPEAVLIIDGGEIGQWCQACLDRPGRIINGPSGAIGGSIPYAIGAKAERPDAPVIAMMGDGTAGFHFMELETALRADLPFVAVVGNDARWNAEHQIQLRDYGPNRTHACELSPARYDRVAVGLGCHGENVTSEDELVPALERAIASGKPACVNVAIEGLAAPAVTRS